MPGLFFPFTREMESFIFHLRMGCIYTMPCGHLCISTKIFTRKRRSSIMSSLVTHNSFDLIKYACANSQVHRCDEYKAASRTRIAEHRAGFLNLRGGFSTNSVRKLNNRLPDWNRLVFIGDNTNRWVHLREFLSFC